MWRFALISAGGLFGRRPGCLENIDKVNGSIRIEGSRTVGDLSTVNGSIDVGEGSRAEPRDGQRLDPAETACRRGSVETVNGSISLGADAQVLESAETVNGRITLEKRAQVGGRTETVNGDLLLDEAKVDGQLRTVNGDITVGAASHVGGGILIEDTKGWKLGSTKRVPKIVIGPGAVVDGTLRFEREVKLYVSSPRRSARSKARRRYASRAINPEPTVAESAAWASTSSPAAAAPRCPHRRRPPRAMPIHGRCRSNTVIGRRPARGRNGRPVFQR